MRKREEAIREYFSCWIENDPEILEKTFAEDVVYSECYGPEYRGIDQIKRWFDDWHKKGRVLEWTIKSFLHQGNQTAVEWYFRCDYDGESGFDGVSLIEFTEDGRIRSLKEFQSKAEHEFPYGEGAIKIIPGKITDRNILELFSEHDTFMLDILGEDRIYYTRYSGSEKLERVWTACLEGHPVGCIAYRTKEAGTGEVKRLFIRPAYRGRGLSKALLNTLERYAKEQGCRRLYLDTRITLEPAVSLYRGFGFQITFQQGLYIQMEKEL